MDGCMKLFKWIELHFDRNVSMVLTLSGGMLVMGIIMDAHIFILSLKISQY